VELFSPGHLIVLLIVVAVLFFGWKQLPDMARSAGRSLRVFRTEIKGMGDDDVARDANKAATTVTPPVAPAAPVAPSVPVTPVAPTAAPTSPENLSASDGPAKTAG
jgi:sec-independent protein translocase protein TatA